MHGFVKQGGAGSRRKEKSFTVTQLTASGEKSVNVKKGPAREKVKGKFHYSEH